jgi:hypothetical protein
MNVRATIAIVLREATGPDILPGEWRGMWLGGRRKRFDRIAFRCLDCGERWSTSPSRVIDVDCPACDLPGPLVLAGWPFEQDAPPEEA